MKPGLNISTGLIISSIFFLPGCEKAEIGKPFECKIGTRYLINGDLSFTIDSLRDYRCPADVVCIWAGDVDIYFNIDLNFNRIDTLIYLYTRNRNPFEIGGYSWRVLDVTPLGKSTERVDPGDYRIKLLLQEKI